MATTLSFTTTLALLLCGCRSLNKFEDVDLDGFEAGPDCDDADPEINPDMPEVLENLLDDDCDGLADEIDLDEDGVLGGVDGEDCDDEDTAIPADLETCHDGKDNNCVPEDCDWTPEDALSTSSSEDLLVRPTGVTAGDQAGYTVAGLPGSSGEAPRVLIGAPTEDGLETRAGVVHLVELSTGGTGAPSLADGLGALQGDSASAYLGSALAVRDDGAVAIGAPGSGDGGRVYLIDELVAEAGRSVGADAWMSFDAPAGAGGGRVLAWAQDDLLIGASAGGEYGEGQVYLLTPDEGNGALSLDTMGGVITASGGCKGLQAGGALASLDLGGATTLAISGLGACAELSLAYAQGAVFLVNDTRMDLHLTDETAHLGAAEDDRFGAALAAADLDGDGCDDLLVGAPGRSGGDGAVIWHHSACSSSSSGVDFESPVVLRGFTDQGVGEVLNVLPDLDGDDRPELLIGAPSWSPSADAEGSGMASILLSGLLDEDVSTASYVELSTVAVDIVPDASAGQAFGAALGYAQDANADGAPEILVGAPGFSDSVGAVFAFFGPAE